MDRNLTISVGARLHINSFLLSLIICANCLCWPFAFISNMLAYIVVFSTAIIFLLNVKAFFVFNIKLIKFLFFMGFLCIISWLQAIVKFGEPEFLRQLIFFICLGVTSILVSRCNFNFLYTLRYILFLAILLVGFVYKMDLGIEGVTSVDYGQWMGVSYGILPLLNACLFLFFFEKKKYVKFISLSVFILYIPFFVTHAPRGAMLSVLLSLIVCLLIRHKYSMNNSFLITLFICFLFFVFSFFFDVYIYNFLDSFINEYGIRFLKKIIESNDIIDLMNGRDELYKEAINGFLNSPLIGNGIGSFQDYSGHYPHNIFLQILYEGGILFFSVIIFILLSALKIIFKYESSNIDYRFIAYLFFISIVHLMFSSSLWISQIFWLMIGFTLHYKVYKHENSISA